MTASGPRISPRLLAELERVDADDLPIAEVARRVGLAAARLGLAQPSYERVRELVHEARRRRGRRTTADAALRVILRADPPSAFVDHLAGLDGPTK